MMQTAIEDRHPRVEHRRYADRKQATLAAIEVLGLEHLRWVFDDLETSMVAIGYLSNEMLACITADADRLRFEMVEGWDAHRKHNAVLIHCFKALEVQGVPAGFFERAIEDRKMFERLRTLTFKQQRQLADRTVERWRVTYMA